MYNSSPETDHVNVEVETAEPPKSETELDLIEKFTPSPAEVGTKGEIMSNENDPENRLPHTLPVVMVKAKPEPSSQLVVLYFSA